MLAGSVLGLNPAAAGLGLSTPRQPAGKARLASPFSELPAGLSASLPVSSPALLAAPHPCTVLMLLTHPRVRGVRIDEQKRQHGDGLGKEGLQKSHSGLWL